MSEQQTHDLWTHLGLENEQAVADDLEVKQEDLHRYAWASGDNNPIHYDEDKAKAVGLPGVIAHGMFSLALIAKAAEHLAKKLQSTQKTEVRVASIETRFVGMLLLGDTLSISGKLLRKKADSAVIQLWAFRNQDREKVTVSATVTLSSPLN